MELEAVKGTFRGYFKGTDKKMDLSNRMGLVHHCLHEAAAKKGRATITLTIQDNCITRT